MQLIEMLNWGTTVLAIGEFICLVVAVLIIINQVVVKEKILRHNRELEDRVHDYQNMLKEFRPNPRLDSLSPQHSLDSQSTRGVSRDRRFQFLKLHAR